MQNPDHNPKKKKTALIVLCAVVGVLVLAYGALCAVAITSESVYPNVDVAGISVGNLSKSEAEAVLNEKLAGVYDTTGVEVRLDGASAATLTLSSLGVTADAAAAAQQAYAYGRSDFELFWGWHYAKCFFLPTSLMPKTEPDDSAVTRAVNEACDKLDIVLPAEYFRVAEEDPDHIYFIKPCDGRTVDREALKAAVTEELMSGILAPVECVYTTIPAAKLDLNAIHTELSAQVQNAAYDKASGAIIPHTVGVEFAVADVEKAFEEAEGNEEVAVSATVTYPEITTEDMEANLFRDTLGTCTTRVTGTANRRSNVRLAADSINGLVLLPGEVFSYNEALGQRTAANGYLPAPAYVKGETVDEIGGGICQISSTLYYACLRGNLKITERWAHRFAPSYIALGMDATVSWGGPDYKFENDTPYPIRLDTSWEGNNVTVSVTGTNVTGNYATMTYVTLSTTAWETEYLEDPTIPAGTQKEKTSPYTGIKVQSYQHHYDKDGNLLFTEYEATSDYKVRNKVILVAPGEDPTKETIAPVVPPTDVDDPSTGPAEGGEETPPVDDPVTDPVTPPATGVDDPSVAPAV